MNKYSILGIWNVQEYFSSFYCIGTRKGTHIRVGLGTCTVLDCSSNEIKDPIKEPFIYTEPLPWRIL